MLAFCHLPRLAWVFGVTIFVFGKMLYLSTFSTLSRASSLFNNEPSRRTLSYMINHIL